MDEEKKAWLKSTGAGEFPEPVKYIYTFPGYPQQLTERRGARMNRAIFLGSMNSEIEKNVKKIIASQETIYILQNSLELERRFEN